MHATTIELRGPTHLRDRRTRPERASDRNKSLLTRIGFVLSNRVVINPLSAMHVQSPMNWDFR
jgi:hypothetical protein